MCLKQAIQLIKSHKRQILPKDSFDMFHQNVSYALLF